MLCPVFFAKSLPSYISSYLNEPLAGGITQIEINTSKLLVVHNYFRRNGTKPDLTFSQRSKTYERTVF